MDEMDRIEEKLKGHYWKGDPSEARHRGDSLAGQKKPKWPRWMVVSAFAISCLAVCAASVTATWFLSNHDKQYAGGGTDSAVEYARKLGEFYYPAAIHNIVAGGMSYGDMFYAFNDEDTGFIAISLDTSIANSVMFKSESGAILCYSEDKLSSFGIVSLNLTFSVTIVASNGNSITSGKQTVDLRPFFYSAKK